MDLKTLPDLVNLLDKSKNDSICLTYRLGSHHKIWWHCDRCGFSYDREIQNQVKIYRQRGLSNICPICRGKRVVPEYNSLKARYPKMIEMEWDFEKNIVEPDQIAPHTNKKVWWVCQNGHSYTSSPNNKLNGGGDCPYCSHQKVSTETSLFATYPEIAREWHPTRNNLEPKEVLPQSNLDVWWKCSICGTEFKRKVYQRVKSPFGCKVCNKGRQTSVSEQLVFRFISNYFPDAINTYRIDKITDIDIYIPSIKLGIEYDGARYHKNKVEKDIAKTHRILSHGIKLVRIRERGCPKILIEGYECIDTEDSPYA